MSAGVKHGTLGGYTNHSCRCDACRAALAAYRRAVRQRSGNPEGRAYQRATREAARRYRTEHPSEWSQLLYETREAERSAS